MNVYFENKRIKKLEEKINNDYNRGLEVGYKMALSDAANKAKTGWGNVLIIIMAVILGFVGFIVKVW